MNPTYPSPEFDEIVAAVCHGTASEDQQRLLSELLRRDPAARDEYLLRVELHSRLASDPELFGNSDAQNPEWSPPLPTNFPPTKAQPLSAIRQKSGRTKWVMALAACLALLLGSTALLYRRIWVDRPGTTSRAVAMLNRTVNAQWNPVGHVPRLGAPLEPGTLRLDSGLAQIVFYNGARVAIEGPTVIQLESSSKAILDHGKLTAEVPPQARGFQVVAPRLDVTDLGTSFGLNTQGERTELHVFAGQVEFRSNGGITNHPLAAGNATLAEGSNPPRRIEIDSGGFGSLFDLQAKSVAADARRYDQWRRANQRLRLDPALWVHLDFEHGAPSDWRLPNAGALAATVPDATIVGCQWQEGRWPTKPALEFRGVSDRVRLSVPGTSESLTLAAWVRVQGLDRPINSLFMSDGFAPGTVHWVLRNDGVLGLTVIGPNSTHQILVSPPVLTVDQFGIWTHLAVVLDGRAKHVTHYLNGQPIRQQPVRIAPPYRVGTAELGNWNAVGFPGNDPFLIRNFSGVMDEFCLFGRALSAAEIRGLYSDGKPQADALASLGNNPNAEEYPPANTRSRTPTQQTPPITPR